MKVILVEILIVVVVAVVLYAIRNKIRFFRGGYVVRKDSYMQDDKMKILVEDTHLWSGKAKGNRSIRVDGTNLIYSRIPLDKAENALLVYGYCAPFLSMQNGTGASIKRALVLGGGGGAVPLYILQNYENAKVDVVEINADSIRMCEKYFLQDYVGENARANMILDDAKNAVKTLEPTYQFIFCDLYIGGQPVDAVYDPAFMKEVSRLAGSNGMLAINGGSLSFPGMRVVLACLLSTFKNAWAFLGNEGFVLLASNRDMPAVDNMLMQANGVVLLHPNMLQDDVLKAIGDELNGIQPEEEKAPEV